MSAPMPVAPAPPGPWHGDSPTSAVLAAPFPPLPPHSKQKNNETIQAFFIRRREANLRRMAKENHVDRQRRTQRAEHAKLGQVPSKATVFFWEEEDGHYIRRTRGRGSYTQLWREFKRPQRRFDPISNEWDLCELFEDNDPVFGEISNQVPGAADDDNDDYDDDEMGNHPTFPQNIDMASRLRWEDDTVQVVQTQRPQEDDSMQVMQKHPHDLEMDSIDDLPGGEDLGPDFMESDVPKRNLTEASAKCVNEVYLRFGLAPPRTEKPEYESSAGSLLDALEMRFGFVMPESPEAQLLADVVGMKDIGGQLASEKGLANIVGIFFGQCMEARSVNNIDMLLLDFHQRHRFNRGSALFEIRREHLKSMRNPSQEGDYFVLCNIGSGIGSGALLIPRATDLLEILCQRWGPDLKDVVRHLLARGIPFWLAYVSAEIMPARETPVPLAHRPKGFKADTSSGLGFRAENYKFDVHDYNAYTTQHELRLLHTPRGRIALQYGGIIARLARAEVSDEDFFRGFKDDIYNVGDCLWDGQSRFAYWHDVLSDREIDLLCGIYHVRTGQKQKGGKGKGKQARPGHASDGENGADRGHRRSPSLSRASPSTRVMTLPECESLGGFSITSGVPKPNPLLSRNPPAGFALLSVPPVFASNL
ncbi:hypothetical protein B0H10DRAFT_2216706 [Mycena sp. CBHHK59/15]|nr:hypothetical protein B0H10DRAFT_2216706 [Mycena sp. CBHHK59/15]